MPLAELQEVLDRSLANATEFTRTLFTANPLTARQVQGFANEAGGMTLATVNREAKPHAAPVICGCADGVIYFSASKGSALLRNIRREPAVAFTIGASGSVIGQGSAILVGSATELGRLVEPLEVESKLSALILDAWDGYIYSIQLSRIFAS